MVTRGLLWITLVILAGWGCSSSKEYSRPNILFITTDGQSWEDVPGSTSFLDLPALKELQSEGVVFTRHYSVAPISVPSRYSIISGRYPHYHKMMNNGGNWLPNATPLLMERLDDAGYTTVGIGKMDFKPLERKAGFDYRIIADGQGDSSDDTLKHDDYYYYLKQAELSRWDYLREIEKSDIYSLFDWPLSDTLHVDYFIGNETVKMLKNDLISDKSPWFMWVSFNGPHYPWDAPKKITAKYSGMNLPGPRIRDKELDDKPYDATWSRYTFSKEIASETDQYPNRKKEIAQRIRAGHYGSLAFIDQQIQSILDALKERDDFENTIVVFTSVQGALLGDHQNYFGGLSYERASHVPFIVWWPGHFKKKNVDGFTSHVDIFPTLVDMAIATKPDTIDGNSLLPVLMGRKEAASNAFIEVLDDYSVVVDGYKLGLYTPYCEGELYDLKKDPDELYNVYGSEEYRSVADSLTQLLVTFYPGLRAVLDSRISYPSPVFSVEMKHGDNLKGSDVPDFNSKKLSLLADIKLDLNATGPIITCDFENLHGFSLFVENGEPCFGVRKWGKDVVYRSNEKISRSRTRITVDIDENGVLTFSSPAFAGKHCFQTWWPLPVPEGHREFQSKTLCAGNSGDGWNQPYGNLKRAAELEGFVYSCNISIGE